VCDEKKKDEKKSKKREIFILLTIEIEILTEKMFDQSNLILEWTESELRFKHTKKKRHLIRQRELNCYFNTEQLTKCADFFSIENHSIVDNYSNSLRSFLLMHFIGFSSYNLFIECLSFLPFTHF
jgi:hypothetical protein